MSQINDLNKTLGTDTLGKTDIVIDCGANVGSISALYAKTGATVYAFEPNPFAFTELEKKFADVENVHCFCKAVSDHEGTERLFHHENSLNDEIKWSVGSSIMVSKVNIDPSRYSIVETINLSKFIKDLNARVNVIKMDIEGAECQVIRNLIQSGVINSIDYMIVETHEKKIPELQEETEQLRQLIASKNLSHINLNWI